MLNSLFIAGQTKKSEYGSATDGKLYYIFIDKRKREASYLTRLIVDILEQAVRPVLLKTQYNGTVFIPYNALRLKELITKTLSSSELSQNTKIELKKLANHVSIEDNPSLLVGVIKN